MQVIIEAKVQIQNRMKYLAEQVTQKIDSGEPVMITLEKYDEKRERKSTQNRMVYRIYSFIGKQLYGGDEDHARKECKLRFGCAILYRDSKEFAMTFDRVIRPLEHELRLEAMDLVDVSSVMTVEQCSEYIDTLINNWTLKGVDFNGLTNN